MTTDPLDPRLRDIDPATGMQKTYLVLSEEERAKGFVRPVRDKYKHLRCGAVTSMGRSLAETYARQPSFYGGTYCIKCKTHYPVGPMAPAYGGEPGGRGEFVWDDDGSAVGS